MAEEIQLESQSSSIGPQKVDLAAVPVDPAASPTQSQPPRHPTSSPHQKQDQLAVGHHIIQIGSVHGGIVQIAAPEQQPQISLRATPVFVLPRPFAGLLGRQTEIATAIATLQAKSPVELYSGPGFGKSVLLRHLAYDPQVTLPFPHGTVHLEPSPSQPVSDVLQALFDLFCQSDIPFKPTEIQIRQALQHQQALILLDDQHLQRQEVEILINAVPGCTFFLASPERRLEEGRSLLLPGLPLPESLVLMERELGRALTDSEKPSAQALWNLLEGNPRHLLYAAGQVRNQPIALAELVRQMRGAPPLQGLIQNILTALSEQQRWILAGLAALGGIGLLAKQAAAFTNLPDAETILKTLQQAHLVQSEGSHYSLSRTLVTSLQQTWDLTAWREQALHYFSAWAEQHQAEPHQLLENMDAIAHVLQFAVSNEQWAVTLQLVRTIEGTLALSKQWGLWARVLEWGLLAARSLGDGMTEAWALHQLGTRALCLDDLAIARELLTQSLQLREALGDEPGAAVTRHNLSLLPPVPLPLDPQRDRFSWPVFAIVLGLLLGGLLGLLLLRTKLTPPPKSLILRPAALDFASQTVGVASSEQSITLENQHPQPVQLGRSLQILGSHAADFAITTNQCPVVIPAQTTCWVKIRFQPTDLGQRKASLVVVDPGGERQIPLIGRGLQTSPTPQPNQAPVAEADTVTTAFEQAVTIDVLANDRDADGDALTFSLETQPEHGSARVEAGAIAYQPEAGFSGTDQFTYKLQDGRGGAATATVTITIEASATQPPEPPTKPPTTPENQTPVANADTAKTEFATPVTIAVLENDSDPEGDRLSVAIESAPQNGVAEINDDGTVTYQPNNTFSGSDTFTYQVRDSQGNSATATVTITVAPAPNQAPIATDDQAAIAFFASREPRSVTIPVLDNDRDPDNDSLQIASATNGKLGSVGVNDDQTITYSLSEQFAQQRDTVVASVNQPPLKELVRVLNTQSRLQPIPSQLSQVPEATDRFTYTVTDGRGGTATATVTVTIDFSRQPEPETQTAPEINSAPF